MPQRANSSHQVTNDVVPNPPAPEALPGRSEPIGVRSTGGPNTDFTTSGITDRLKERWESLVQRFSEPLGSPQRGLGDLIRDDVEFAVIRLKYYQRYYPLQVLGVAAAAAFLLGAVLSLGRRNR